METQNEDKREPSEQFDSSNSAVVTSKESQGKDPGQTNRSHEVDRVLAACKEPHDPDLLIALATSVGGLINDEVRKVACRFFAKLRWINVPRLTATKGPILLGYRSEESELTGPARSWRDLPHHKDEDQVELDVNRSFIYYPKSRRTEGLLSSLMLIESRRIGNAAGPAETRAFFRDNRSLKGAPDALLLSRVP